MKVDVEGYELEVLKGSAELLVTPPRPILCVEYGNEPVAGQLTHFKFMKRFPKYFTFVFSASKFSISPLRPWRDSCSTQLRPYDNVIYIPNERLANLPTRLFESRNK